MHDGCIEIAGILYFSVGLVTRKNKADGVICNQTCFTAVFITSGVIGQYVWQKNPLKKDWELWQTRKIVSNSHKFQETSIVEGRRAMLSCSEVELFQRLKVFLSFKELKEMNDLD